MSIQSRNREVNHSGYCVLSLNLWFAYELLMLGLNRPTGVNAERILTSFVLCLGGVVLIFGAFKESQSKFVMVLPAAIRLSFFFLLLWGVISILRAFSLNTRVLTNLFGNNATAWAYLTPIAVYYGANPLIWKRLSSVFMMHCRVGIIVIPVCIACLPATGFAWDLTVLYSSGYMLLRWDKLAAKERWAVLLAVLMYVVGAVVLTTRAALAGISLYILYFIAMQIRFAMNPEERTRGAWILIITIIIIMSLFCGLLAVLVVENVPFFQERMNALEREVYVDSRSLVNNEFMQAMSPHEMLIGRGVLGTYWSSYFRQIWLSVEHADSPDRQNIESGCLQLILKGGYIMLALYFAVCIPAGLLGIFKSRNSLAKAAGFMIIVHILSMIVSDFPLASPKYILLWLGVGACYSKSVRLDPDL